MRQDAEKALLEALHKIFVKLKELNGGSTVIRLGSKGIEFQTRGMGIQVSFDYLDMVTVESYSLIKVKSGPDLKRHVILDVATLEEITSVIRHTLLPKDCHFEIVKN